MSGAVDRLLSEHLPLVRRFRLTDFYGHALEALWQAAKEYDVSCGVPFRSFAVVRVKYARLKFLESQFSLPKSAYKRGLRLAGLETWTASDPSGAAEVGWDCHESRTPEHLLLVKERALMARLLGASSSSSQVRALARGIFEEDEYLNAAMANGFALDAQELRSELERLAAIGFAEEAA